jgi:hypothetical protein
MAVAATDAVMLCAIIWTDSEWPAPRLCPPKSQGANLVKEGKSGVSGAARRVFADLHDLGAQRLFQERVKQWAVAYSHRGTGSTYERAQDIDGIYDFAAPIPGEAGNENASELLSAILTMVKKAVGESGGLFQ